MCGILGMIGEPKDGMAELEAKKLFVNLFQQTKVRGDHACGFAAVMADGSVVDSKLPVTPRLFMHHDRFFRRFLRGKFKAVIAHTRYATNGEPEANANNHPHFTPNKGVAIVHNGVCDTLYDSVEEKMKTDCDSEAIAYILGTNGIKKGSRRCLVSPDSMAVLALNMGTGDIYTFRESSKPTVVVDMSESHGVTFFASTEEIFKAAWKMAGLTIPYPAVGSLEEDHLYHFKADQTYAMEKVDVSKREVAVTSPYLQYLSNGGSLGGAYTPTPTLAPTLAPILETGMEYEKVEAEVEDDAWWFGQEKEKEEKEIGFRSPRYHGEATRPSWHKEVYGLGANQSR